jgi:hypothetical protein
MGDGLASHPLDWSQSLANGPDLQDPSGRAR